MSTTDVQNAIDAAQKFYRSRVRNSWVFDALYSRNLADILRPAQVGWAPRGWTTTTTALLRDGHSEQSLLAAGISRHHDDGTLVDVLHDRMTFTIRDWEGNIAGFTGRAAPDAPDSVPKWLNTPATDRFRKKQLLYGAEDLKPGTWPVFVEGTLDRWAIIKATKDSPIPLTPLAPCGTSLTAEHLQHVRAITDKPFVLAFDGDDAGQKATLKAWEDLIRGSYPRESHRAIVLPDGADPADLVAGRRSSTLVDALNHPVPLVERAATIRASHASLDPEHTVQRIMAAQHSIDGDIQAVPLTKIVDWMKHLSTTYGIDMQTVHLAVVDAISPEPSAGPAQPVQPTRPAVNRPAALHRTATQPSRPGITR